MFVCFSPAQLEKDLEKDSYRGLVNICDNVGYSMLHIGMCDFYLVHILSHLYPCISCFTWPSRMCESTRKGKHFFPFPALPCTL